MFFGWFLGMFSMIFIYHGFGMFIAPACLAFYGLALISASSEDFGLTPVEAAACGTPSVLLRGGGFLDTCIEGVNGVYFDDPTPSHIARAVVAAHSHHWDDSTIIATSARFSSEQFAQRILSVVEAVTNR